jgi:hypothetical protein
LPAGHPFLVNGRGPPCFESGRGPYFLYSKDDHRLIEWKMTGFVKTGSFNVGEQQPLLHRMQCIEYNA